MTEDKWYEFFKKSNGEPIAYIKGEENSTEYKKYLNSNYKYQEINQSAEKLEYKLIDQGSWSGAFKYKTHAIKFNQEVLNGKGIIAPNN